MVPVLLWTWLVTLAGCGGDAAPSEVGDTPLRPRTVTTAAGCTWSTQSVGGLIPEALFPLSTGEVIGVSDYATRVRRLDGSWHYEPQVFPVRPLVAGATDLLSFWQIDGEQLHRRDLAGRWASWSLPDLVRYGTPAAFDGYVTSVAIGRFSSGLPDGSETLFGVHTSAPGGGWSYADDPVPEGLQLATPHHGDTWVLAGPEQVWHGDPAKELHEVDVDGVLSSPRLLQTAEDGAILIVADGEVFLGTVEEGLRPVPLPDPSAIVTDAWVGAADDIWGMEYLDYPHATRFWHYDGATWSEVAAPGRPLFAFTVVGGQVVAVGREGGVALVATGDAVQGITVQREEWVLDGINALAVDDVDGTAWGVDGDTLLAYTAEWELVDRVEPYLGLQHLAVSGGRRLALRADGHGEELQLTEPDGEVFPTVVAPTTQVWATVGRGGVLHAFGAMDDPEGGAQRPTIWSSAGPGHALVDAELVGLPVGARVEDALAAADGRLLLALALEDETWALGEVTDGVVAVTHTALEGPLEWMGGGVGEPVVVALGNGVPARSLQVLDGETLRDVPELPDHVRAAHRYPDGSWLVVIDAPYARDAQTTLEHVGSSGAREVLATELRSSTELIGHGDHAWFVDAKTVAHTVACP